MNWAIFGCVIGAVLLMLAYFLSPEKVQEIAGDLLIISGWLIIFSFFCYFWATGNMLCVEENNIAIRTFETIAIFGLLIFGAFRLKGDI